MAGLEAACHEAACLEGLVEQVLGEAEALRERGGDPSLEALRVAILVEDVFGVVLADDEIEAAVLAEPAAVARLVSGRLGREAGR